MLPTIVFLQVFACFDFEECKMNITTCNVASWLESNGKDETGAQDNSLIPLAARVAFINTLRQMSINFPVMVTVLNTLSSPTITEVELNMSRILKVPQNTKGGAKGHLRNNRPRPWSLQYY